MKKQRNHIGQRIREKRLELGWSQARLAEETGLSRVYILKLEKAQIESPGVKALFKISWALGIGMEALWK
jgi:transcriptional regulator with XRE-family HTH domain